ncbi:hypothetical protein LCGC14_0996410 [marine sediment metagenome]|uniref:Uncharacterized protein n=1 Tax=marine sediment metagenome TaxID=412755 RepID=A0A0F9QMQ8_9ZZZZ
MAKFLNTQIPYVYIYYYAKIKDKHPYTPYLKPIQLIEVIKNAFRNSIPRTLYYPIFYQMEECKLIKRINHQRYRILKYDYKKTLDKLRFRSFWD